MKDHEKRNLFDSDQVRLRLHISQTILRKYVKQGKLRALPRNGPKDRLLFRRETVEELAKIRPSKGFKRGPKSKEEPRRKSL